MIKMTTEKLFEQATRNKYRYQSQFGTISTEDLWDLTIVHLNDVYKHLKASLKQITEDSLLNEVSYKDKIIGNKIEIVEYIFITKREEAAKEVKSAELKEKKQYLLSILKDKQNEELRNKSLEELQALIDSIS